MKKVLYLMLALVSLTFTACSSDSDDSPKVSFEKASYALSSGSVSVRLVASASGSATEYPVTFGGTAVMNQDYTVSATKYVIGGTSPVTAIEVRAKNNFTEAKTITMTAGGATTTVNLGVRDKSLYSFEQKVTLLGTEAEVVFTLQDVKTGSAKIADEDITVTVSPDSKSTAVEGVNYAIENKTAVIVKGKSSCSFKLKSLKKEEGKDIIVLNPQFENAAGFVAGLNPVATVQMIGSNVNDLMGEWQMNQMVSDLASMKEAWGGTMSESEFQGFPELNKDDKFVFSGNGKDGLTLTTDLKSTWKNYFNETSGFTIDKEYTMRVGMGTSVTLQLLRMKNVNRFFSDKVKSDDKEALVGVRNIKDENGNVLLDVYVIDYESKSFFPSFFDFEMYNKEKPTATMSGVFLNFTLKKAQ